MKPSEIASLSNSRLENHEEFPNHSRNNWDMAKTANCYVICEWGSESVSETLVREKLSFWKHNWNAHEKMHIFIELRNI